MTATKVLAGQILAVVGIVVAGLWLATQWIADQLGYQMRLGPPWFHWQELPIYYPWRIFEWWYAYDAYAPDVFNAGGAIAAASAGLAVSVAVAGSVWRARQSRLATTYGSARWATRKDIRATGLTSNSGVFLGKLP